MLLLRKVAFYLFLCVYLVACPLTILYALGYVVNPGAARGMIKTGLISLSSAPPGAVVYLEGRRYTQRTPTILRDLLPGEYRLTLLLKDHEPWIRTVSVVAEKATTLDRLLLWPKKRQPTEVLPEAVEHLIPASDTRFVLVVTGPRCHDVVVYDEETNARWPLMPLESPLAGCRVVGQTLVRGSSFLLVRVRSHEGDRFLGIDLEAGEVTPMDLTSLFPSPPRWVTWDPQAPHQLFAFQNGSVNQLHVEAMTISPRVVERVRGYGVAHKSLYVLTEDLAVQRMDQKGKLIGVLFDDPVVGSALFGLKGLFHITALADHLMLFQGERGELVIHVRSHWVVEHGVRGFAFDPQRERLLLWRKDRIGVLDLSPAASDVSLQWVFHDGRDIEQAFWVYHGSHVLFRDHDAIALLELEPSPGPAPYPLLQVRPGSSVAYSEALGTLYYLDRTTDRFSSLEILPRNGSRQG